ncbi:MAG: hypothetical protein ACFFD4_24605 [Candidatus Odinarchaeota archaeon]
MIDISKFLAGVNRLKAFRNRKITIFVNGLLNNRLEMAVHANY